MVSLSGNSAFPIIAALVTILALLALNATSALARQAYLFSGSFGAATSTPANPYPLSKPEGMAVDDATHDVYVADTGNRRVEKFDASGNFLLAFGADVGGPGVNVCGGLILCSPGTPGTVPGQLSKPVYLAVDNSSGPSKGDVYVADAEVANPNESAVSKFDSSGNLVASWGVGGRLDGSSVVSPPAPLAGPFGKIYGIAVDPSSGNLWVYGSSKPGQNDFGRMFEFAQDSTFVTDWATNLEAGYGVAAGTKNNLYFDTGPIALEFTTAGSEIGDVSGEAVGQAEGLALNSLTGSLYLVVKNESSKSYLVRRYDASCHPPPSIPEHVRTSCTPVESFGSAHLAYSTFSDGARIAADSSTGAIYASETLSGQVEAFSFVTVPDVSTVIASNFTSGSATLNGTVDPGGVMLEEGTEGCRFEWGEHGEGESKPYGHVAPCDKSAAQVGAGSGPVEVHANLTGLQAGTTYHFRLVASNANTLKEPSVGKDVVFGPPLVDSEWASSASATSMTVGAEVNPQNVDTQVQVEYGTDTNYGQATPNVDVGVAATDQLFSQHLQGLAANTTYHYRVVAHSVLGTLDGEDASFTTQDAATALTLPDGRQWELVSPPDKRGGLIARLEQGSGVLQASATGERMTYWATVPTESGVQGYSQSARIFSSRGPGGWSSQDISLPHGESPVGAVLEVGDEYDFFSEDLSLALTVPLGEFASLAPHASPPDSESTIYVRHDLSCADSPATCFEPLVTGAPGYANVPEGTKFGSGTAINHHIHLEFYGATPDLAHVVLSSPVPLTSQAFSAGNGGALLYEWAAGKPASEQLQAVTVLPTSEGAGLVGGELGIQGGSDASTNARHAISRDGSRVFWSREGHLYMREFAKNEPESLSLANVQGGSGEGPANPEFQTASTDGSLVLFTDEQALTANSGASKHRADLYQCAIVEVAGKDKCNLTDLTPPVAGQKAQVEEQLLGASDDGSYVYFVAAGALTSTENSRHETPVAGGNNLYMLHYDSSAGTWEAPRLIVVLSSDDKPDWGNGGNVLSQEPVRVSSDGRFMVFMSDRSLTGYDNRDANSGKADEEVFLYDAGSGRLVCASCNPTGARPTGVDVGQLSQNPQLPVYGWQPGNWLAANVPGWTTYRKHVARYQSRYLSGEGRVFFNSRDALVPQDINKNEDVYEYEPVGVGDCSVSSSTFSARSNGCIALISSGVAAGESTFLDASENGNDVFFLTGEQLVREDVDTSFDVYDAHACTLASPCANRPVAPPACTTADSCRAAPLQQPGVFGAPSSATFSGAGNVLQSPPGGAAIAKSLTRAQRFAQALKACRREKGKRKREECVRHARRRHAVTQSRKTTKKSKG